jgi:hypothetical protein
MARPKHADTRYLELKNGKFRVTVAVPRALCEGLSAETLPVFRQSATAIEPRERPLNKPALW